MNTYQTTREVFDDLPFFYFAVANDAKSPSLYFDWENRRNLKQETLILIFLMK